MFFTLRKNGSFKNCSLKYYLGNENWFFYGITFGNLYFLRECMYFLKALSFSFSFLFYGFSWKITANILHLIYILYKFLLTGKNKNRNKWHNCWHALINVDSMPSDHVDLEELLVELVEFLSWEMVELIMSSLIFDCRLWWFGKSEHYLEKSPFSNTKETSPRFHRQGLKLVPD